VSGLGWSSTSEATGATSAKTPGVVLVTASLLAVAMPWLRLEGGGPVGFWLINLAVLGYAVVRNQSMLTRLAWYLSPQSATGLSLCAIVAGAALTTSFVGASYYTVNQLLAPIISGVAIAGSAALLASRSVDDDGVGAYNLVLGACLAGYIGLVVLPLLLAPGAFVEMLSSLVSGQAGRAVTFGYRPMFESIDAVPGIQLPEGRAANLRHEPALLFAVALARVPVRKGTARYLSLPVIKLAAGLGVVISLSRSAIIVAGLIAAVSLFESARRGMDSRQIVARLVALAVGGWLLVTRLGPGLADRFGGEADRSAERRWEALTLATELFGRGALGVSTTILPADYDRPHVFLLDLYLGAGLLGVVGGLLLLTLFVTELWRLIYGRGSTAATDVRWVLVAALLVASVRYFSSGWFWNAAVAWYSVGLLRGAGRRLRYEPPPLPSLPESLPVSLRGIQSSAPRSVGENTTRGGGRLMLPETSAAQADT
jgi:hypothetical protein